MILASFYALLWLMRRFGLAFTRFSWYKLTMPQKTQKDENYKGSRFYNDSWWWDIHTQTSFGEAVVYTYVLMGPRSSWYPYWSIQTTHAEGLVSIPTYWDVIRAG